MPVRAPDSTAAWYNSGRHRKIRVPRLVFNSPFRQAALASRSQRQQLDRLLRITAPHERILLAGIGLVLLVLVAWAVFGSIVRAVTIDGILIAPGARHPVVSTEHGQLEEFFVAPGDRVAAGDPIARQTVPDLDREVAALQDRMAILETEVERGGGDGDALLPILASARTALLQMDAQRTARQLLVSPAEGEVMALRADFGAYLPAGAVIAEVREAGDGPPLAVLRVAAPAARRVQPGMRASVEFKTPGGVVRRVEGEIASVTSGPLPGWLAAMPPAVAESMHRVDIVLVRNQEVSAPDGTPCRVRIVLGRHPPAALLVPGRV